MNGLPEAQRPPAFISASAVGYYGTSERATFNEQSGGGTDFLAEVCKEWESAAQRANTRVVILRNGIVLSKEGGALGRLEAQEEDAADAGQRPEQRGQTRCLDHQSPPSPFPPPDHGSSLSADRISGP